MSILAQKKMFLRKGPTSAVSLEKQIGRLKALMNRVQLNLEQNVILAKQTFIPMKMSETILKWKKKRKPAIYFLKDFSC